MANIVYSIKSHRRIAHYEGCRVLKRIAADNTRTFRSVDEARSHGYRLCSCCAPIVNKIRRERQAVRSFCEDNQLEAKIMDGALHVISRHDYWCLIACSDSDKLTLYHRNKRESTAAELPKSLIHGFHAHTRRSSTVLGYLKYICEHDIYRDRNPYHMQGRITWFQPVEYVFPKPSVKPVKGICSKEKPDAKKPHGGYQRIKGTKKYRKEQKRKKRQKRAAGIKRVYALIDGLSAQTV